MELIDDFGYTEDDRDWMTEEEKIVDACMLKISEVTKRSD